MKFDSIQQFFFLGLLLVTTGAFLWILSPYLFPVFWAMVIAVVFYPFYTRVNRYYKGRASLASFTTVLGVIAIVLVPLLTLGGMIIDESVTLYQSFSTDTRASNGLSLLERAEQFAVYFEPYGISQEAVVDRLRTWATSLSQVIATSLITLGQGTFSFVISFAIMLYLLFFLFRDGERLQHTLMHYIPLGDTDERRLFTRFAETARAVIKGTPHYCCDTGSDRRVCFLDRRCF
jgi:predicted PurR-regulated permease PerM